MDISALIDKIVEAILKVLDKCKELRQGDVLRMANSPNRRERAVLWGEARRTTRREKGGRYWRQNKDAIMSQLREDGEAMTADEATALYYACKGCSEDGDD